MLGSARCLEAAPSLSVPNAAAARSGLVRRWSLAVTALLLLALGAALATNLTGGRSTSSLGVRSHGFSRLGILSLPLAAQRPVSAALGADGQAYRVSRSAAGFTTSSPAQRVSMRFAASGMSVRSGTATLGAGQRAAGLDPTQSQGSCVALLCRVGYVAGRNQEVRP